MRVSVCDRGEEMDRLLIESAEGEVRFGREGVERSVVVERWRDSVRKGTLNVDPEPDCEERCRRCRVEVDERTAGGDVEILEFVAARS